MTEEQEQEEEEHENKRIRPRERALGQKTMLLVCQKQSYEIYDYIALVKKA